MTDPTQSVPIPRDEASVPEPAWLRHGAMVPVARAAAAIYGIAARAHRALYALGVLPVKRVDARVVCCGNLTVGGSGKTPTVIALARALLEAGNNVGVISRGYGGSGSRRGSLVCNGTGPLVGPDIAGDEPALIAASVPKAPLYIGADRFEAARRLVNDLGCEIILMDDGFSHHRLHRDLDILLVDAENGFGNSRLLPAGPLREPLAAVRRAGAVILSKGPARPWVRDAVERLVRPGTPVFESRLVVRGLRTLTGGEAVGPDAIKGREVLAFCGLAHPQGFYRTIEDLGAVVARTRDFSDHHRYSPNDCRELADIAASDGLTYTLTTSKDAIRLDPGMFVEEGNENVLVVDVDIEFSDEAGLLSLVAG